MARAAHLGVHGVPQADGSSDVWHVVHALASRQRGLVMREQLVEAGLTRSAIAHRIRTGRLRRVHPAVYTIATLELPLLARALAALMAAGPGSVLSHLTAAILWRLLPDDGGPIHVINTQGHRRAPDGVVLHRTHLESKDIRHHHGLPVTSPTRTLELLPSHSLNDAVDQARAGRLLTSAELRALTTTTRRPALREALGDDHGFTRSQAERLLLKLVTRAGLPQPLTNTHLHGHEVDALWPDHRLIVEIDSYTHHSSRAAFETDRLRDATHTAHGYRTLRITWRQLTRRPEAIAARLAAALALTPAERTPRRGSRA